MNTPIKTWRAPCDRVALSRSFAGWLAGLLVMLNPVAPSVQAQTARADLKPSSNASPTAAISAWSYGFDGLTGGRIDLNSWRGRPILVVNTASECGYTGQYRGLQAVWQAYRARGLVVVGVPSNDFGGQEPGSARAISRFCELNYGVSFPMAAKSVVTGASAHPFFRWAANSAGARAVPRWNFHKILIGANGQVIGTFPSATDPSDPVFRQAIEAALPARRTAPAR